MSQIIYIPSEVSQGSLLVPILFYFTYMRLHVVKHFDILLYADDIKYVDIDVCNELQENVNCNTNKCNVNIDKCNVVKFLTM